VGLVVAERRREHSGRRRERDTADHAGGQYGRQPEARGPAPAGAPGVRGRAADADEPGIGGPGTGTVGAGGGLLGERAGPGRSEGGQRGGLAGEFRAAQRGLDDQPFEGLREPFGLVAGGGIDSFE